MTGDLPPVERGIPIVNPRSTRGRWRKVLQRLSPGDSIAFGAKEYTIACLRNACTNFKNGYAPNSEWCVRAVKENGHDVLRIWRIR